MNQRNKSISYTTTTTTTTSTATTTTTRVLLMFVDYFSKRWLGQHTHALTYIWTIQNLLRLNDNKTNIYLASPHCVKSLKTPSLQLGAASITPNESVNQCISMYEHVTSVCRTTYYHLKNIHF